MTCDHNHRLTQEVKKLEPGATLYRCGLCGDSFVRHYKQIKTYDERLQAKLLSSERPKPLNEMQIDILRGEIKELREENARLKSIIEGKM